MDVVTYDDDPGPETVPPTPPQPPSPSSSRRRPSRRRFLSLLNHPFSSLYLTRETRGIQYRAMRALGEAFKEIFAFVVLALVIVVPLRLFVAQPFSVQGDSMYPTFKDGDYLIVEEVSYYAKDPARGDVVVFRYPNNPKTFYIKRLIGLPGEKVTIVAGKTTITQTNGTVISLDEPYVVAEDATYTLETTLGTGQYFVMGDNRPRSSDSRVWGPLPEENIMGRAFLRLLPPGSIGVSPGAYQYQ
jgi:signal peptidase I